MVDSVIQLLCECKNDPWGKQGKDSLAARLCALTPSTPFEIDESKTYSEVSLIDSTSLHAQQLTA